MKLLSFFDGMSCGQIALKDLGYKVDTYYSAEIDKFAIEQTQHNFPNTIQLGSVTDVKAIDLPKIDLFIGGSPCQGFSFAGKQLNFDDPRSKLFFEYVRVWKEIKEINPEAKFLLENVNMKKEYLRIISEYLGMFPVRINSNLVSAQNRDRWFWTNIKTKETGLFAELWSDIPQPKDRGILLKDILQDEREVDEKYYLSDKLLSGLLKHADKRSQEFQTHSNNGKAKCITVSHQKQNLDSNYVLTGIDINGKAPTQRSSTGRSLTDKHNYQIIKEPICVAMRGRNIEDGKRNDYKGAPTEQRLEPNTEGKTNCLTSVAKDNLLTDGHKLRRLTPTECARLQTIPEWYKWIVSDTQCYKMLGNGWTVEVIKHIFSFL